MPYGEITVGDLRKLFHDKDIPDNATVCIKPVKPEHICFRFDRKQPNGRQGEPIEWNYNAAFVHNAYSANDDRLEQSTVVVLEIGDMLP